MIAVDTNIVVRYVVSDDPIQSERVRRLLQGNEIFVALTVVLETEWVLRSVYGFGPIAIIEALESFIGMPNVVFDDARVLSEALRLARQGIDLADAMHLVQAEGCVGFATFDRVLAKRARATDCTPIFDI